MTLNLISGFAENKEAIWREKLIKKWWRAIKMEAIEHMNPEWKDLYCELMEQVAPDPVTRKHQKP